MAGASEPALSGQEDGILALPARVHQKTVPVSVVHADAVSGASELREGSAGCRDSAVPCGSAVPTGR